MGERFVADESHAGLRLDRFLAQVSGRGRSEIQRMISAGKVTLDGIPVMQKAHLIESGNVVAMQETPVEEQAAHQDAEIPIRYEDDHLAVVSKPPGLVVHAPPGHPGPSLAGALSQRMPLAPAGGPGRPGIVHRLDRDTSGLLIVAKTDDAHRSLVAKMQKRQISRSYIALAAGTFRMQTGRIEAPVGRSSGDRMKMSIAAGGREATTEFEVREELFELSLLDVRLRTGRTHQIRVHLAYIKHPIVGDASYGRNTLGLAEQLGLERMFLHAARLEFAHPLTSEMMSLEEPLPADLTSALEAARRLPGTAEAFAR